MTRLTSLLLAGVVVLSWVPAMAQPGGIVPQSAEGSKLPPPPGPQPGATVGAAADSPPVAAQADGQPMVTDDRHPPVPSASPPTQAMTSPPKPAGSETMPTIPTDRTPDPLTSR